MRRILLTLLTALLAVAAPASAAIAVEPVDIVVDDNAGVLDRNTLLPALEQIQFRDPTTVAIYTYRGNPDFEYADDDTVMNEETLRYARAEHPEWISADGQKWADGLFLFTLDPDGRWIGTYFGEDRKVDSSQAQQIRDEAAELFRDAQWTDGTIAAVEEAAKLINRPWYLDPFAWFLGGAALLLAGGTWVAVVLVRRSRLKTNRALIAAGEKSYASVSMDLDATELNAHTIPDTSRYGAKVLEEHRTFRARYNRATELGNTVRAFTDKDLKRARARKPAEEFAELSAALDGIDDVIADTNTLLNMGPGWQAAWDRQSGPLLEELDKLEDLFEKDKTAGTATAAALLAFRTECRRRMQAAAAGLADGSMSPESGLDVIHDCGRELAALLKNHSETVIEKAAKNSAEKKMMREALEDQRTRTPRYRNGYRPGILDTAYPKYFWSVASFNAGVQTGTSKIESARSSASSGSSSGYGASGGSFSGSGSSSRF
ncbi:DUF5129 domain-containing protein [Arthrobacter gandavensis]|uniref:DUF5129 domain-containing protein n=1 Tax=Arthrobacter gandavensis TaxID=169960 RepID=UPI00188E1913|nr:DUF5129 domain-containing protein [Arthrobacter gandavensis]MBF4993189.1 DUF5129 domain-containing protein [Arthrobacter gandavensis]